MRLKDKVALITGAGKGIGAAIARRFAREGAWLALCDINEQTVRETAKQLSAAGAKVLAAPVDVTNRMQVEAMVEKTLVRYGTVDILINNAGINRDALMHKMTEENWDAVLETNLKGTFYCIQAVIDIMRDRGYGRIINLSSTSRFGNVGQANYAASKAGIVGLTRAIAKELGPKGVTANCIAPGTIITDMFMATPENIRELAKVIIPLKRHGTVDEVANVALFLASDEASYVTGQCIHVDGGMCMP
ncbi:MAG: 3-oxoacyl-ACP reductase FabG [Solirubrobacterales bacterium]